MHSTHSTVHSFRTPGGVTLGVEHFGDAAAPLVLLVGGTTMLSWPDKLCEALARGGRHVVRYDLRDSGASTTVDPEAPGYTLRDLAADAAALARGLDDRPAHLAGIGVGGMVAQVAALDHPDAFSALTLAGTRPVAPGPVDDDLPDHDAAAMGRRFALPTPDWADRTAVAEYAAAGAEILGDDPAAARARAERIFDRTPSTQPAVGMANQLGMVFSKLDCTPRWRERLPELAIPALVVHGRHNLFFPVGNGEALAREIPGARLLVLEQAATAIPDAARPEPSRTGNSSSPRRPGPSTRRSSPGPDSIWERSGSATAPSPTLACGEVAVSGHRCGRARTARQSTCPILMGRRERSHRLRSSASVSGFAMPASTSPGNPPITPEPTRCASGFGFRTSRIPSCRSYSKPASRSSHRAPHHGPNATHPPHLKTCVQPMTRVSEAQAMSLIQFRGTRRGDRGMSGASRPGQAGPPGRSNHDPRRSARQPAPPQPTR